MVVPFPCWVQIVVSWVAFCYCLLVRAFKCGTLIVFFLGTTMIPLPFSVLVPPVCTQGKSHAHYLMCSNVLKADISFFASEIQIPKVCYRTAINWRSVMSDALWHA